MEKITIFPEGRTYEVQIIVRCPHLYGWHPLRNAEEMVLKEHYTIKQYQLFKPSRPNEHSITGLLQDIKRSFAEKVPKLTYQSDLAEGSHVTLLEFCAEFTDQPEVLWKGWIAVDSVNHLFSEWHESIREAEVAYDEAHDWHPQAKKILEESSFRNKEPLMTIVGTFKRR